jgi:NADPH:quinone reductase-like Zn-dependent oxidoreductase
VVGEDAGVAGIRKAAGAPPAVVIEPLGGEHVGTDVELVARGGAVGVLGTHVGALSTVRTDQLFLKGVTLYGTPRAPLAEMAEFAGMVADGVLTPLVDRVFELADVRSALGYCASPKGIGRVLLSMGQEG